MAAAPAKASTDLDFGLSGRSRSEPYRDFYGRAVVGVCPPKRDPDFWGDGNLWPSDGRGDNLVIAAREVRSRDGLPLTAEQLAFMKAVKWTPAPGRTSDSDGVWLPCHRRHR